MIKDKPEGKKAFNEENIFIPFCSHTITDLKISYQTSLSLIRWFAIIFFAFYTRRKEVFRRFTNRKGTLKYLIV